MLYFRTDLNKSLLLRQVATGRLVRLANGIYSTDTKTEPASQIRDGILKILAYLRPGSIISHSSALLPDMGASMGLITVTDPKLGDAYVHDLPGMKIIASPGPAVLDSDSALNGDLYSSSPARAFLENLEPSRINRKVGQSRQMTEESLLKALRRISPHNDDVNKLLAAAKTVVMQANGKWAAELDRFERLVERSKQGVGPLHLSGDVDWGRIELFEKFSVELKRGIHENGRFQFGGAPIFPNRPDISDLRFHNLAFFESYFSNYIEGTEFPPDEAYEIATATNPSFYKSKEGHDIRALFGLYSKPEFFLMEDSNPQEFINNLKAWHAHFGEHDAKRPIHPGQFKDRKNWVGGTKFTEPNKVEKTLKLSWEIGETLASEPYDCAIFRAASTVCIHPFLDGNGRITRLSSSSLLARHGLLHPIIPTVFREDYLLSLQAFSNGDVLPIIRMYARVMDITASVPFEKTTLEVAEFLEYKNAFRRSEKAKWGGDYVPSDEKVTGESFLPSQLFDSVHREV